MTNLLLGLEGMNTMLLTEGHIFELSAQLVSDLIIQGIAIFILFFLLSGILFEPVKKVLNNRTERIRNDIESASKDKEAAAALKAEYDEKIKSIDKERETYYNYFTKENWGDRKSYDLMIDTSKIGVDKAVELIKEYLKLRK